MAIQRRYNPQAGSVDSRTCCCLPDKNPFRSRTPLVNRLIKDTGRCYIEVVYEFPETIENTLAMLKKSGFQDVRIRPVDESVEFIRNWISDQNIEEYVISATIEATKPAE